MSGQMKVVEIQYKGDYSRVIVNIFFPDSMSEDEYLTAMNTLSDDGVTFFHNIRVINEP